MSDFDPITLFEAQEAAAKSAGDMEQRYQVLTQRLFTGLYGREWLGLAMARMNYMGSVFSAEDGMSPTCAAHRDGMRSVISDILNSAAQAPTKEPD